MKFARFWRAEEVTLDKPFFGKSRITIWGASDSSEEDALSRAKQRVEKFRLFVNSKFDRSIGYEYGTAFLREEVVDSILEHDAPSAHITRNRYGALVLNTADVAIGDIDLPTTGWLDRILYRFGKTKKDKDYYLALLENIVAGRNGWGLRVYETHSGLRFFVVSQRFAPDDSEILAFFREAQVDPLYLKLCNRQQSFRARLSPKPWRIDMERPPNDFPRSGPDELDRFEAWRRSYEEKSQPVVVARPIHDIGEAPADSLIRQVLALHDRLACGGSGRLA